MPKTQRRVSDFFQTKRADNEKLLTTIKPSDASCTTSTSKKPSTLPVSPSKLNAQEVGKRLGKVRNLAELRERLGSFSDAATRLNKQREKVQLQVQAVERAAHESSPVKNRPQHSGERLLLAEDKHLKTPEDNEPIVPAYERYAHLVSVNVSLDLPAKYRTLLEMFRASDQVISIMYNRNEVITFDRLKPAVQQMTRKNFDLKHLGQLKSVYQEAYKFEQLKLASKFSNSEYSNAEKYCLVVTPNIESDLRSYDIKSPTKTPVKRRLNLGGDDDEATPPCSPLKLTSPVKLPWSRQTAGTGSSNPPSGHYNYTKPMSGARLICRTEIFRKNLYKLVTEKHREFLASLTPAIEISDDEESRLKRWHPEFPLDTMPEILPCDLPLAPTVEKIYSAREMLQKSQKIQNPRLPAKLENALKTTAEKIDSKEPAAISQISTMKQKCLAGIPAGVLEKIRAKESERKQRLMRGKNQNEEKVQKLQRLPDMIRIIRGFFATENKNVLPYTLICKKLSDSYSKSLLSSAEIELHLELLIELAPDWLTKTSLHNKGAYLRMEKNVQVLEISKKIDRQITTYNNTINSIPA